jgi:NADP-dependent 3-hydroxy acid dehydrogenase YdfG
VRRSLNDRTAVVCGATGGIGAAIARALADEGMRLVLIGRDAERLQAFARALPAAADARLVALDLTDVDAIVGAAREITSSADVDVLVHAAGAFCRGPVEQADIAALDRQYVVNVRAPFAMTQALLPSVIRVQGQIVFINSSAGLAARAGVSQYAATKHALKAIADSLREEVHALGVRVISLYPGRTATAMQEHVRQLEGTVYDPAVCLQPADVGAAVVAALTMPETAEIKDISLRPMGE